MVYYQANTESPVFPDLRGLLVKTAGLVDILAAALKSLAGKLRLTFVYGSIASGQERSDSDIDLMVIGTVWPADLAAAAPSTGNARTGNQSHCLFVRRVRQEAGDE